MKKLATYGDLLKALSKLNDKQLGNNITLVDSAGEYHGVQFALRQEEEDDVLDQGHPFLETDRHEIVPATD